MLAQVARISSILGKAERQLDRRNLKFLDGVDLAGCLKFEGCGQSLTKKKLITNVKFISYNTVTKELARFDKYFNIWLGQ